MASMRGITTRVLGATAVGVLAATGSVLSATLPSALGSDYNRVNGTTANDHLSGTARADLMAGRSGNDVVRPDRGTDIVRSAGGDDRIFLFNDGDLDRIHCGAGFDVVSYHFSVDQHDIIDVNCEGRVA